MSERRQHRELQDRPRQPLTRDAGAIEHRDLAFAVHAVERVDDGDEHRHRQDERDELRQRQDRHPGEGEACAPVGDDDVELVQALCEDRDRRQRPQDRQERTQRLPEHVS